MSIKIGFICSFSMQESIIKSEANKLSNKIEVLFDLGVLEEAIPNAKHMEKLGAEVIVAWGATTEVLEKNLSIPIVGFEVSDFDVFRAVNQASNFGKKIALANVSVSRLDILEDSCGVSIEQVFAKNINEARYGITEAVNRGCEVIIGKSYLALDLAKEFGKKAVLITLTKENARKAISDAVKIVLVRRKEREEYTRLQTIFNSLTEGVLVIDTFERVTLCNDAAEKILGIKETIGQRISTLLPYSKISQVLKSGKYVEDEIQTYGDISIIVSHRPIMLGEGILGVVSTFREASKIQKIDTKIRKKMISRGFIAHYDINYFSAYSTPMKKIMEQAKRFATTDSTILITGESGTGKEVLAQSIHNLSRRSRKPFVAINCSLFPESILESELFGYEEGAFTGARKGGKMGMFELAHRGTLFLDEIGDMQINLQSKLLRVLEEREVMRLGGEQVIPIDVRIIASTNKDLSASVIENLFRKDLYFRLNVLAMRMPSLRERKKDIPDLVSKFVSYGCKKYGKKELLLTEGLLQKLINYPWPGNVRELRNVIERLVLLYDGSSITASFLDEMLSHELGYHENNKGNQMDKTKVSARDHEIYLFEGSIKDRERKRIIRTLDNANFNISRAASILGISRSTLYRKLKFFRLQ